MRAPASEPNVLVALSRRQTNGRGLLSERAPRSRPPWVEVVALQFPVGPQAHEEVVARDPATFVWMPTRLSRLHPHPGESGRVLDFILDEIARRSRSGTGNQWPRFEREVARGGARGARTISGSSAGPTPQAPDGHAMCTCVSRGRWSLTGCGARLQMCVTLAREVEQAARPARKSKWWTEGRASRCVSRLKPERKGVRQDRRLRIQ